MNAKDASESLQAHLNMMRGEPVVRLEGRAAIQHAYSLRMRGLSYASLAVVMGVYHGEWYTDGRWRTECQRLGAPRRKGNFPGRPR